jgi:undecaprenyl-diphosphatase
VDLTIQAAVLGLVQGLTEFLPISSSGHLILVPWLFKWNDPFIDSLAFSVMLHMGTLLAILVYFWRDWVRLVPAGLASIRDRHIGDDPDRRLGWLLVVATIPALIVGPLFNDFLESHIREAGVVAITMCVGAAIMWLAERWGTKQRDERSLSFGGAAGIGVAQILALVPGISRSGVSISGGLFLGLTREAAARFSFMMAAPVVAGAGLWSARKLGDEPGFQLNLVAIGFVAAAISGLAAIKFMLAFLRRQPLNAFIVYRVVAAIVVFLVMLSPHGA